jgi:hypothetical protein
MARRNRQQLGEPSPVRRSHGRSRLLLVTIRRPSLVSHPVEPISDFIETRQEHRFTPRLNSVAGRTRVDARRGGTSRPRAARLAGQRRALRPSEHGWEGPRRAQRSEHDGRTVVARCRGSIQAGAAILAPWRPIPRSSA